MKQEPHEAPIREHSYDGIQEYDKSLPNWWLFTLYATIAFSIGYWIYFQKSDIGLDQREQFKLARAEIDQAVAKANAEAGILDDNTFWAMSRDPETVAAGQAIYAGYCVACHGPELQGGIGVNLVDDIWIHGGEPMQVREIVIKGVPEKGMLAWLPIIGEEKVNQVVAFVLSHHER